MLNLLNMLRVLVNVAVVVVVVVIAAGDVGVKVWLGDDDAIIRHIRRKRRYIRRKRGVVRSIVERALGAVEDAVVLSVVHFAIVVVDVVVVVSGEIVLGKDNGECVVVVVAVVVVVRDAVVIMVRHNVGQVGKRMTDF